MHHCVMAGCSGRGEAEIPGYYFSCAFPSVGHRASEDSGAWKRFNQCVGYQCGDFPGGQGAFEFVRGNHYHGAFPNLRL
jgi:hypothetical protein